ncbi:MAG: hypothetical protein KZQ83_12520 [gamma proteobacterium symbiont of Taylorina sp.]|nr:hypothetical protein [gamma proteobacterium symbiont of Taylorina sp.]
MALSTGTRKGELLAIEWRDIQWKDCIAIIRAEDQGAQKTGFKNHSHHQLLCKN